MISRTIDPARTFESEEDFDVAVTANRKIRVSTTHHGEHAGRFELHRPWVYAGLEQAIALSRCSDNPPEHAAADSSGPKGLPDQAFPHQGRPETLPLLGATLTDSLLPGPLCGVLRNALHTCRRNNHHLRVRLTFEDQRLEAIPWELLYDPVELDWLCVRTDLTLLRYPAMPVVQLSGFRAPLRLLILTASPRGMTPLRATQEIRAIEEAFSEELSDKRVGITVLHQVTKDLLEEHLRNHSYDILHVVAHGRWDPAAKKGTLVLCDEQEGPRDLGDRALKTLLNSQRDLRLVFLNTCDSGLGESSSIVPPRTGTPSFHASSGQPLRASRLERDWESLERMRSKGLAMTLLSGGVPAVIAMQRKVRDDLAVQFAKKFYRALADALPVDDAVQFARMSLFTSYLDSHPGHLAFATPVLFLRSPRGEVFRLLKG